MMTTKIEVLERALARERLSRKQAEGFLEEKSRELFDKNQDLQKLADHLEEMVKDRTRELEAARDEAVRLAHIKSDFLASMSHEIRTPLNAVIGMTAFLCETTLSDSQRDYVTTIQTSGQALLDVINDILDFSKLEAEQLALEKLPLDFRELLAGCGTMVESHLQESGIALRLEIDPAVPRKVLGDGPRLRQIVLNLLSNAVKFTETGEIELSLTAKQKDSGPCLLTLRVRDTGIGIPPEKLEAVFESFSQVDGSTTRKYGGTGLGLAICRRLVSLMEGRIWVESEVGKGTSFFVELELEVDGSSEQADESSQADRRRGGSVFDKHLGERHPLRVLLVEDLAVNQKLCLHALRRMGYRADLAKDGQEAVAAARAETYDLILMDLQMPIMGGLEATREIRSGWPAKLPAPRIIALTASAFASDRRHCQEAGMDGHLPKPLPMSDLREVLESTPRIP